MVMSSVVSQPRTVPVLRHGGQPCVELFHMCVWRKVETVIHGQSQSS